MVFCHNLKCGTPEAEVAFLMHVMWNIFLELFKHFTFRVVCPSAVPMNVAAQWSFYMLFKTQLALFEGVFSEWFCFKNYFGQMYVAAFCSSFFTFTFHVNMFNLGSLHLCNHFSHLKLYVDVGSSSPVKVKLTAVHICFNQWADK